MTIFFIKALGFRSNLMVPMVIQVFKDILRKLSVIWVTVNLPLTTDPLRSWNKKGNGGHFIVGAGCFLTL